jgi:hypothetical protein
LYGLDNLLVLRFIRQLKQHKWSMPKIRKALAKLHEVMDDPDALHRSILIHGKGTILAICKTKAGERILLDTLDPGGQQVMFIVLETLQEETRRIAVQADRDNDNRPVGRFSSHTSDDKFSGAQESLEEVSFATIQLSELLTALDYDTSQYYYKTEDSQSDPSTAHIFRAADRAGVHGIYVFRASADNILASRPAVYVAQADTPEDARKIHTYCPSSQSSQSIYWV